MNSLKTKLMKYMDENKISSSSLSRKAGISSGIIHNIIKSDNPNPTIDSVLKIAKIMNCSLDELFEQNNFDLEYSPTKIDPALLRSVCDCLCQLKELKNKNFNDFCKITYQVYKYCLENDLKQADSNFAKWYINKGYN